MYNYLSFYVLFFVIILSLIWVIKTALAVRDLKQSLKDYNGQRTNSDSTDPLSK